MVSVSGHRAHAYNVVLNDFLRRTETRIIEDSSALNVKYNSFDSAVRKSADQCTQLTSELQDYKTSNERMIKHLAQLYATPVKYLLLTIKSLYVQSTIIVVIFSLIFQPTNVLFMHQMSLHEYFQKLELFVKCADRFLHLNFKVRVRFDSNSEILDQLFLNLFLLLSNLG